MIQRREESMVFYQNMLSPMIMGQSEESIQQSSDAELGTSLLIGLGVLDED